MHNINKMAATVLAAFALIGFTPAANAGLVGLYTYNNASNLGLDSSGNGNNLVNYGGTASAGVYGGGLNLDGGSALLSASGTLAGLPTGGSSYTISSWINPSAGGSGGIVGWGNYGTNNQVNALRMAGDYAVHNYWWANDQTASVANSLVTGNGTAGWHFVAATYDATSHAESIYIDNVLIASRLGYDLNAQAANFAVGRTLFGEYFNGQMDNTAIFNQSLTASQLLAVSSNDFSAFATANVPEPGSMLLLAIGAAAAVGARRRAKKAA